MAVIYLLLVVGSSVREYLRSAAQMAAGHFSNNSLSHYFGGVGGYSSSNDHTCLSTPRCRLTTACASEDIWRDVPNKLSYRERERERERLGRRIHTHLVHICNFGLVKIIAYSFTNADVLISANYRYH